MKISASILAADFARLGDSIQQAETGGVDEFHFDIMDGNFVPNLSFGPPVLEALRKLTALPIDAHMMVRSPINLIHQTAQAGADIITIHIEATTDTDPVIDAILEAGAAPAVAVRPNTPPMALEHVWDRIERVLIMTVEPGFGGQSFLQNQLPKIHEVKGICDERRAGGEPMEIAVDGGIKQDAIAAALQAGASTFIAGTGIYGHPGGPAAGISALRTSAPTT